MSVNVYKVSELLLCCIFVFRYNTFSGYPPEVVKKMPKKVLAEEVSLLLFCDSIIIYHIRVLFTTLEFYSLPVIIINKSNNFPTCSPFRFGDSRQRWGSNLKSPSLPSRNMKGFKMYLLFVSLVQAHFFIGIKVVCLVCRSFSVDKANQILFVSGEGTL